MSSAGRWGCACSFTPRGLRNKYQLLLLLLLLPSLITYICKYSAYHSFRTPSPCTCDVVVAPAAAAALLPPPPARFPLRVFLLVAVVVDASSVVPSKASTLALISSSLSL